MNDREIAKIAAEYAANRLGQLIEDAGPIAMSALDMVQELIEQAIDEAYTTRLEANTIEFVNLDGATE